MAQRETPYKGLRFYETEDFDIFAAREDDAVACAKLLAGRVSVLMLHGRTGCGKSSFLRAALSPLLDRVRTGLRFPGASGGGFRVARSGMTPLREIAGAVFDLVEVMKRDDPGAAADLDAIVEGFTKREEYVKQHGEHFEVMHRILTRLGEAASGTPILVIDQAEEIYTLSEPFSADNESPEARQAALREKQGRRQARVEYMNLLRAATAKPTGVKLLISLRTEYKGLFEDELRREMSAEAGTRLTGFHLEDLDEKGLAKAIRKPTTVTDPDGRPSFRFGYEDSVPEVIAKRLTATDAVPMGGVLPTLQVVCWRLYEQAKRSKAGANGDMWSIQMTDLERLGDLNNQVEVYLRERLEEMLATLARQSASPTAGDGTVDRTREIDQWYRLLDHLVRLQGDGRAVTRQISESALVREAHKLECKFADDAWNYLHKHGILKRERKDGTWFWSLGHDSLGLAIQKWSVTYKDSLDPGMRMDMNSPRQAARLTEKSLFPKENTPRHFALQVPDDALWDHQVPFFTDLRHLSRRIGIEFLHGGQVALDNTLSRVLVAAERAAFPPADQRARWTDVAVSDLFQGNGLVGPTADKVEPVRVTNITDDDALRKEMEQRLRVVLQHLSQQNATVLAYDESARSMIRLAAFLCDSPVVVNKLTYDFTYTPRAREDDLFERLAAKKHDPQVFMVGTAFGRALASHRGYRTYFDCQDLTKLIDLQVKRARYGTVGPEASARLRESFRLYRESAFHTVWQVNIPSAEWRQIEHYPLVMRLAGICYFTADYIRSFADDFVRHLYDWHAQNFESSSHVSRETIREVLRDCFLFLSFDENPRLLFDPDSRYEFNPRDSHGTQLSSTAREIHIELTLLRKRTVDLFDAMCWQIEQIKRLKVETRSEDLAKAEELRGCAWENFRIYNYYDSARLMEEALRLVGDVVTETTSAVWKRAAEG